MKTNRELVVSYKVLYEDDSKPITPIWAKIIQAHADWTTETPWQNQSGEGRVVVPNVGIFEWEVIYDAETPQDTED